MRRIGPAVAILMAYLLVPQAAEMTVDLVHAAQTGHTLHDDGHHEDPPPEHGCSGPYHRCPCHSTVQFVTSAVVEEPAPTPVHRTGGVPGADAPLGTEHRREIERPPSA